MTLVRITKHEITVIGNNCYHTIRWTPDTAPHVIADDFKTVSISRIICIENTLKLEHLNIEEKKNITEICTQYNDMFHLKGDPLTHINYYTVAHEIYMQVDSASVNVKP